MILPNITTKKIAIKKINKYLQIRTLKQNMKLMLIPLFFLLQSKCLNYYAKGPPLFTLAILQGEKQQQIIASGYFQEIEMKF